MFKVCCRQNCQGGFSIVEVLIAVLILAIGLLGVAGVQLASLQQTTSANLRSQATLYAQDAAERINASGGDVPSLTDITTQMKGTLGEGSSIDVTTDSSTATITISWNEKEGNNAGYEKKSFSMVVRTGQ